MAHKRATLFSSRTGKTRPDEKAWKEEKATSSEVIHYVSQCDQVADDVFTAVYGNQQKSSSVVGLVGLLQDCAKRKDLLTGSKLHTDIFDRGLHKKNIIIGNTLVHMYLRCGALSLAKQVFDELPFRTLVAWTMLIAGYAEHGHGEQALKYVDLMREEGLCLDEVSLACILKACGSIRATEEGKKVHAEIVREGLLGKQGVLGGALVDMYAKCGALSKAQGVFNELPSRNTVSWTALITGYCQHGQAEDALTCFERMKQEGVCPDRVTLSCILKACGSVGAGKKGQEIHDEIIEKGLLRNDIVLGNALLDMYAKCGAVDRAQEVFDELRGKNRVSWNSLIGGYCQHGHGEKALDCYDQMIREGLAPDGVTFACALKACGSTGAVEKGEDIHLEIIREGFLEKFCVLGSALVDMYSKCGQLVKAREVFDELPVRDLVSWTALLGGYCEHGCGEEALVSFERMMSEGRSPDAVTFACILKACSSIGEAEKGQAYYETLGTRYGIIPTLQHHTGMVALLGRAGHFDKAISMIKKMPSADCLSSWLVLLGICQKWGNVSFGKLAFEHALQQDELPAAGHVFVTKIYKSACMQEHADIMEDLECTMGIEEYSK